MLNPTPQHRPLIVIEEGGLATMHSKQPVRMSEGTPILDPTTLQAVRDTLLDQVDTPLLDPVAPASQRDPAILRVLRHAIGAQVEAGYGPLRDLPTDEASLLRLFHEALGWGPAQPYLDDERIQEVKIIGDMIMVQEEGGDFALVPERFSNAKQALDRALLLAARLNVPLDRSRPQDTLPLAHGTRMHVTIPPCTPEGSALICIRRGRRTAWQLDDVLGRGACDANVGDLLRLFVRAGCSFLIAGETGSGKTALLEAIINSWPGQPHVVTIEDNALEINVRHATWTRELVQSAVERGAFGRAAKEVLRQTPSLVAPGETRAEEAGAILAVAVSGHAVATTIHARSAARAIQRFADCAAMPGAYIYEGRRSNALEDACDNFHVVLHLHKRGGRRYISELILLDGVTEEAGRLRPRSIRLAWAEVNTLGELIWQTSAVAQGNGLIWHDDAHVTPEGLQQRLDLLNLRGDIRASATTRAAVDDALARAEAAQWAGKYEQALAILQRSWSDRRDQRLVQAAQHVLEHDLVQAGNLRSQAHEQALIAHAAVRRRQWTAAQASYTAIQQNLAIYAAYTPQGGWEALAAAIELGLTRDREALAAVERAVAACQQERMRDALDLLATLATEQLSDPVAQQVWQVRRTAALALARTGEIGSAMIEAIDAALSALARTPGVQP
jgi:Flp pilus assembly CpaF family ATPase